VQQALPAAVKQLGECGVTITSVASIPTAAVLATYATQGIPIVRVMVPVGRKWRVDETYTRLNGKWTYIFRAIDQDGQVVDASFSRRRNARAAETFFRRAIDETGETPTRVTTDKAKCYPPALRTVLPDVEHRTSKYLNNGIERDHGHLKQRLYPMRGFKRAASADIIARGHALIRTLRNGFSALTAVVPINLRLAVAWPHLARAI
jgi:transposase-like protein